MEQTDIRFVEKQRRGPDQLRTGRGCGGRMKSWEPRHPELREDEREANRDREAGRAGADSGVPAVGAEQLRGAGALQLRRAAGVHMQVLEGSRMSKMSKEERTEWLCRDCVYDPDLLVIQDPLVSPRVSETGQVIPGSPQVVIMKQWICEKCGEMRPCFEYRIERMEEIPPPPEVEDIINEPLEWDEPEEEEDEKEQALDEKLAEIKRLKAELDELLKT